MTRRCWPIRVIGFFLFLFTIATAGQAFAHATLIASDPPDGAVLPAAPQEIVLTFNEPAGLLAATLVSPDGGRSAITGVDASAEGNRIVLTLPPAMPTGTSILSWRAASSDGHPISGTVVFSVGRAGGTASVTEDTTPRPLLWLCRAIMFAGLFLGAGASGFRMVAPALPERAKRTTLAILPAGIVAVIASVPLQGLDLLGRSLGDIANPEVWQAAMTSAYGASAAAALVAFSLAALAVGSSRSSLASWISVFSLAAIGLVASLSGHASAASPQWLTRPMVFIHVVSTAWWAGELLPLATALRLGQALSNPPLLRFSRFIPFVIVPLLVSGVTLAVIQLGPPGPAWQSAYGLIFVAKLTLVAVLLSVAAFNRWGLTSRVVSGHALATRHLTHAIAVEIVLIIAIVGLAAGWRFTPPPRALTAAAEHVEVSLTDAGNRVADLAIRPGHRGANVASLRVETAEGAPLTARSAVLSFSNEPLGIGPIKLDATSEGDGVWRLEGMTLPVAGEWNVVVQVRISDFELTRFEGRVLIGP
jgi:copper transport protein